MTTGFDIVVLAPLYPTVAGAVPAAAMRSRGLCRALVDLGHRVDVVCGMPLGASPEQLEGVVTHATRWVDFDGILGRVRGAPATQASGPAPAGRALASRLLPPDRYVTWIPGALVGARRSLRDDSVILSTSAKSAHLAARAIAGHRPWIADLNDPWTDNPHMPVGAVRGRVDSRLEALGLGGATHITTVTPPLRDELAARFGDDRVTTLMSGFDLGNLDGPIAEPPAGRSVVLYAGTLYERFDLEPLYRALAAERDAGTITPASLLMRFVGRLNERVRDESAAHGVAEFFEVSGPVPRAEILSLMSTATALLLPLYEEDPYSLPMKFYEYVGAGRPIVALGPADRFAARLIEDNALGAVVSSVADVAAIVRRLADDPHALPVPTRASRELFTWERTTETLAEILEQVTSTRRRG